MASDVRIILLLLVHSSLLFSNADFGLKLERQPADKIIAPPGAVILLSCSPNLPVDNIDWHLNHHSLPSRSLITPPAKSFMNILSLFKKSNCHNCSLKTNLHNVFQQDVLLDLFHQEHIDNILLENQLKEGISIQGEINGTSYLAIYLASSPRDYASQLGIYQCVANLGTISLGSDPTRVDVASLGSFLNDSNKTITVSEKRSVRVQCGRPISYPPAFLTFTKNGERLTVDGHQRVVTAEGDLLILSTQLQDAGEYKCYATNDILNHTSYNPAVTRLEVTQIASEPLIQLISPISGQIMVREGEDIALYCASNVGLEEITVWWHKSDSNRFSSVKLSSEVNISSADGVLHFTSMTSEDGGRYTCNARVKESLLSASVDLHVQVAPQVQTDLETLSVSEGDRVEVVCNMTGLPFPLLFWLSNGKLIHPGPQVTMLPHGVLILDNVSKEFAGVLQCFGHNAIGSASSQALLTVTPRTVLSTHDVSSNTSDNGSRQTQSYGDLMAPSRPTVERVADETVRLHWQLSRSPVRFYKAQYRLVGSAVKHQKAGPWSPTKRERRRWRTDDASVAPDRNTTLVSGLIPGNTYKFRIAAVFASDDQRVSASSTRFMLQQLSPLQPPSFPPNITGAKWVAGVGSRNLELQWTYGDDSQTDGFIVATSVLHSTLPPAKRRFIGSSRRTVTILNVLHEADVSAEGGLLIWLLAYNMAGTSPPSPPRTIHHYQDVITQSSDGLFNDLSPRSESISFKTKKHRKLYSENNPVSSIENSSEENAIDYSNESEEMSGETLDSQEEEDVAIERGELSSYHLLGLLLCVMLTLLAVVGVSYCLYSRREKRGYVIAMETLDTSATLTEDFPAAASSCELSINYVAGGNEVKRSCVQSPLTQPD